MSHYFGYYVDLATAARDALAEILYYGHPVIAEAARSPWTNTSTELWEYVVIATGQHSDIGKALWVYHAADWGNPDVLSLSDEEFRACEYLAERTLEGIKLLGLDPYERLPDEATRARRLRNAKALYRQWLHRR